jgi:hypothetical protein
MRKMTGALEYLTYILLGIETGYSPSSFSSCSLLTVYRHFYKTYVRGTDTPACCQLDQYSALHVQQNC